MVPWIATNERLYWSKLRALGKDTDCGRYKIMIHAEAAGEAAAEAVNHDLVPAKVGI